MGNNASQEIKLEDVDDPLSCLLNLSFSHVISQCLYIAAKLDIATIIGKEKRALTAKEIATEHGGAINIDFLQRILRLLSSKGIFKEVRVEESAMPAFQVSSVSQFLRTDIPNQPSCRFSVIHWTEPSAWRSWARLESCVMSSEPKLAFKEENQMSLFEYYSKHPESAKAANNTMTNLSQSFVNVMLKVYAGRWAALERNGATVVDVGGGHGLVMKTIKEYYPRLDCKVVELQHVVDSAPDKDCGVEFVVGDFFKPETLPKADVILMKYILHDWNDEDCGRILQSCHLALNEGGRLILAEAILPNAGESVSADLKGIDMFFVDMQMLVIAGGKERTADEWPVLLEANRFRINEIIKTPIATHQLIETYKV